MTLAQIHQVVSPSYIPPKKRCTHECRRSTKSFAYWIWSELDRKRHTETYRQLPRVRVQVKHYAVVLIYGSEGTKWRQKGMAGAHVSFTIRSHEPISFMFLVLTVSLGFHPSPTADKLKAKEQNKLFVRVPALQLLTLVTRIRITYPSSAFIEQRRVRIYIYTWRSIWTVVAPVLACSLTPVPNEDCVASHLSLFILLLLRTFIVFFPLSKNISCDWKLFLPWQNE